MCRINVSLQMLHVHALCEDLLLVFEFVAVGAQVARLFRTFVNVAKMNGNKIDVSEDQTVDVWIQLYCLQVTDVHDTSSVEHRVWCLNERVNPCMYTYIVSSERRAIK